MCSLIITNERKVCQKEHGQRWEEQNYFTKDSHLSPLYHSLSESQVPTTDSFTNSLSVLIRSTFCKETISRVVLPVPGSLCGFPAPGPTLARRHGLYCVANIGYVLILSRLAHRMNRIFVSDSCILPCVFSLSTSGIFTINPYYPYDCPLSGSDGNCLRSAMEGRQLLVVFFMGVTYFYFCFRNFGGHMEGSSPVTPLHSVVLCLVVRKTVTHKVFIVVRMPSPID